MKMPENFNNYQICRPTKRNIRIILYDIMDCYVPLVRMTSSETERTTNVKDDADNDNNHNRRNLLSSHQIDHNYSLPVVQVLTFPHEFYMKKNKNVNNSTLLSIYFCLFWFIFNGVVLLLLMLCFNHHFNRRNLHTPTMHPIVR